MSSSSSSSSNSPPTQSNPPPPTTLRQLEDLIQIDQDITDDSYGTYYNKRSISQLFQYGIILLDKPPGPTSHEVVAWTKRILKLPKIGHSGTLDPQVSGVLPLGLGEATKALGVLLLGPKEYYALGRFHRQPTKEKLDYILNLFCAEIFQKPPQRSAVVRATRSRHIYELDLIEQKERLVLLRVLCESGTYIRKLFYDMGEILGPGATMIELRRSRVNQFYESTNLVTLHKLADAYASWEQNPNDPTYIAKLSNLIQPVEHALSNLKSIVIRDSAVDALCHGAQLAIPGILKISPNLQPGDLVAIYTLKGEAVALAESLMSQQQIQDEVKGYAFQTKRIIMAPNTYPKNWRTKSTHNNKTIPDTIQQKKSSATTTTTTIPSSSPPPPQPPQHQNSYTDSHPPRKNYNTRPNNKKKKKQNHHDREDGNDPN